MRRSCCLILILLGSFLLGCDGATPPVSPIPTSQAIPVEVEPTPSAVVLPTSEPTQTPKPAAGILYAPDESDPGLAAAVADILMDMPGGPVLVWDTRPSLAAAELSPDIQLVVALPPAPDLDTLVAAAPGTSFVSIGITSLTPAPNLVQLGPEGFRPDRQAFLAGYLAAVITEDWRVGILSSADTAEGQAARQGFVNGVRFFCGLCLPEVPPYAGYPLFADIPPAAEQSNWRAAADLLLAAGVKTVYLDPEVDQQDLRGYLVENGAILIGGATPENIPAGHWAATVAPDFHSALERIWGGLFSGSGEGEVALPLQLSTVDETLVSPGRQRLVESIIPDLARGLIDTGITPPSENPG